MAWPHRPGCHAQGHMRICIGPVGAHLRQSIALRIYDESSSGAPAGGAAGTHGCQDSAFPQDPAAKHERRTDGLRDANGCPNYLGAYAPPRPLCHEELRSQSRQADVKDSAQRFHALSQKMAVPRGNCEHEIRSLSWNQHSVRQEASAHARVVFIESRRGTCGVDPVRLTNRRTARRLKCPGMA